MRIKVKPKILVVVEPPDILLTMRLFLERAGLEVFGARNGADAIRLSQNEEFDLVILDVNLPAKSGFEVCAWLKRDFRFSRTPIIFTSSRWNEEDRYRVLALGAAALIDQPLEITRFLQTVFFHLKTSSRF